jgi:hypothetical protein
MTETLSRHRQRDRTIQRILFPSSGSDGRGRARRWSELLLLCGVRGGTRGRGNGRRSVRAGFRA